ncbi:MAG: hypothetical protein K0U54_02895, partial [Bacteroidetes bacterium]|nr:hypothetical protein [Bacteroidota bacterium]
NTNIGTMAGFYNLGSGNVFIGHDAGKLEVESDKLYIDNSDTSSPLLYGDFAGDVLAVNGKLGVGTMALDADSAITVNGKILCEEVEVIQDVAPDYVFQKYYLGESSLKESYSMPTLEEVEAFTKANHHLPEVPSAKEIKEEGMGLKEMSTLLLQKVEELTLYTIEQEKRINALEKMLAEKE